MKNIYIHILFVTLLLLFVQDITAQDKGYVTISGTVYEKERNQETLPSVSIVARDIKTKKRIPNCATVTDLDGCFKIKVPVNCELLFSFVSSKPSIYKVKEKSESKVSIYMEENVQALDETVIIGYQQKSKASVAASVTVVKAEELADTPVSNVMSLLQGRVAGLDIQLNNGLPGAQGTFTMRGVSDISIVGSDDSNYDLASSSPLFVIDGIPQTDVGDFDANGLISGSGVSPLSTIPLEDIEEIQVLKDAAATSLYGSDGAYGVILIETKKGNSDKPQFTYSGNFTVSTPPSLREVAVGNAERRLRMMQILQNDTSRYGGYYDVMFSPSLSDSLNPYWNNNTDWQGQFYRVTYNHSHNLSFTGGNSMFNYKINGNYYTEKGIVKNTDFNRYSISTNMNYAPNERFSAGVDIKLGFTTNSTGSGSAVSQSGVAAGASASSLLPPPSLYSASVEALQTFGVSNVSTGSNYSATVNLKYRLPFNIRWVGTFNYKYSSSESEKNTPAILANNNYLPIVENGSSNKTSLYARTTVSRGIDFKYVGLNLVAGIEYNNSKSTGNTVKFTGTPNDYIIGPIGYGRSSGSAKATESKTTFSVIFNPDFKLKTSQKFTAGDDRYIFTPTLRPEICSVYGTKTKWIVSPSLSARWNIYKEPFMKSLKNVNMMAIKASWGRVVKYSATRYDVWGAYEMKDTYTYNGESYIPIKYDKLPNVHLDPVTSTTWNLGYELGLFNGKLRTNIDAYYRQVDNQLSDVALPDHSGFNKVRSTETSLVNYGLETAFTIRPLPTQSHFDLTCGVNFAINKDVITKLPNEARQIIENKANIAKRLGANSTSMLLYINKGVYATDDEVPVNPATGKRLRVGSNNTQDAYFKAGDPIWVDVNGDYIIDEKDKVVAGNMRPLVTGGCYFNLGYKNLSIHTSMSFVIRRNIINSVLAKRFDAYTTPILKFEDLRKNGSLAPIESYNFWTETNRYGAEYPNPFDYTHAKVIQPFREDQTLFLEDGSYFKINTVSISYRLPKRWLSFLRIRTASLKASVNNIWTFSGYSGISPESVNGLGRDTSGGYPNSRTWTVGVTLGL